MVALTDQEVAEKAVKDAMRAFDMGKRARSVSVFLHGLSHLANQQTLHDRYAERLLTLARDNQREPFEIELRQTAHLVLSLKDLPHARGRLKTPSQS
jgi:predicted protein tyrosine phosphatase